MRSGQLANLLGISKETFKRYRREGRIPDPTVTLSNGWHLWDDTQVKALLARRIERGLAARHRV